jgi:hypothetical protein
VRPGRVLFGGLVLLYLLAYLRGPALLVAVAATVGVLGWRSRRTGGRTTSGGASSRPDWGVQDGRVVTKPVAAEVRDPSGWPAPTTVVQVVPEPRAAGQPGSFAALVELGDHAGRQAMLQVEAVYPAEVELEQLVRQALTQTGRRAGWQLQRWRPVSDASFPPASWTQVGEWGQ